MDIDAPRSARDPVLGSDLEYDLAHESEPPRDAAPSQAEQTRGPVQVATETPGYDGDYGYDRMDGGPGRGDVASFATDVGAERGGGVKVSLAKHRARGDGHDRLFRFEGIEGSAFDDILVGNRPDELKGYVEK